ncbi:hypothetical protein ABPG75_001507 [Micractinium tetrahymenae]
MRQRAAELVAEGADWMEGHWREARWAGLAVAAGSVLFMLRWGHIPGWMRYTSLAELPPGLLAPQARRLPVALHSVAQRGEALAVRVAHYPLLSRLADVYRGVPTSAAALRAAERGELLTVHLAGPIQPTEAGLRCLQSLPRSAVHRLRLLSVVHAGEQSWTTAGSAAAAAAPPGQAAAPAAQQQQLLEAGSKAGAKWWRWGSAGNSLSTATAAAGPPPADRRAAGAPGGELAVPPGSALARQERPAVSPAAGPPPEEQLLLWGELYARERRAGLAALLPRRRAGVAERLIGRGEAALMEPIDLEWLGVSWASIDRLYAAEQAAIASGLGMWAVRRPTLGEWSRSLARSAWVRVRHAARTSAAAAAGSLGGAAAAAGGALTQAAAAGAGGMARAAGAMVSRSKERAVGGSGQQATAGQQPLPPVVDGSGQQAAPAQQPLPPAVDGSGQQPAAAQPLPPPDAGEEAGGSGGKARWWSRAGAAISGVLPRWRRK